MSTLIHNPTSNAYTLPASQWVEARDALHLGTEAMKNSVRGEDFAKGFIKLGHPKRADLRRAQQAFKRAQAHITIAIKYSQRAFA